jgi:hypothetical protein
MHKTIIAEVITIKIITKKIENIHRIKTENLVRSTFLQFIYSGRLRLFERISKLIWDEGG